MSRLYLLEGAQEIARRRSLLPPGSVVEAWPDVYVPGLFWVGEESKRVLDSTGEPFPAQLVLAADDVGVYYGPHLRDIESLPPEDSLRSRVLSAHGIAVVWATLDRAGRRTSHEPQGPSDPVFHLRRRGGSVGHVWRLFETRTDAVAWMREAFGAASEGAEWAESLPVEDFDALLKRGEAP